jgi:hypothetical protein
MLIEDDGAFRTTDLTEAALLASQGFSYSLERLNRAMVAWVFADQGSRDEELTDLVNRYKDGGCRVEPRAFMSEIGKLRSELYTFLGIAPKRVGAPSSRPS